MKIIISVMLLAMLFGFGALHYFKEYRSIPPYQSHDVSYLNPSSGLTLSGTLTIPYSNKPVPAIILVAGTGKHDRDCTSKGHRLFFAIADYLTRRGIAVLRYDKRGVGKSQGVFDTTLTTKDFASDAMAGLEYMKTRKEIDHHKIGLLGHSEGGLIIAMVAAQSDDVKFLVSMAGAATTTMTDIVEQASMQLRADGASQEIIDLDRHIRTKLINIIHQESDHAVADTLMHQVMAQYLATLTPAQTSQVEALAFESANVYFEPQAPVYALSKLNSEYMMHVFNSDWVRFLISYDAFATLRTIKIPVLAVNGALDFVVAAKITLPVIEKALIQANNQDYQIVEMPSLNHWFQPCKTGSISEYGNSRVTISPDFLELIGTWVQQKTK